MLEPKKTHRLVKNPQVSARYLADYMAASETAQRTIVRNCKYQKIARVVQHDDAKLAVSRFLRDGDRGRMKQTAQNLRERMADSDFDRDVLDHNADYIDRFAMVCQTLALPDAEILAPGKSSTTTLNGVKVNVQVLFRLRRITKTNKVRVGIGTLRYAKGKVLSPEVGEWQSAFMFGYLSQIGMEDADPEHKLCVTLEAHAGVSHSAPTDSIRRFHNMEAACASIAERWSNIPPPLNAVL